MQHSMPSLEADPAPCPLSLGSEHGLDRCEARPTCLDFAGFSRTSQVMMSRWKMFALLCTITFNVCIAQGYYSSTELTGQCLSMWAVIVETSSYRCIQEGFRVRAPVRRRMMSVFSGTSTQKRVESDITTLPYIPAKHWSVSRSAPHPAPEQHHQRGTELIPAPPPCVPVRSRRERPKRCSVMQRDLSELGRRR